MKPYVVGFTIVRNAQKYDYPVVESICSILPICDEFIVSIGNSDDATEQLIRDIGSDKIKIIHSVWDDSLREGGQVLAVETDKAFDAVPARADWVFYIQADEVVHEQYHLPIVQAMTRYKHDLAVEGLLLHYTHFYGSYEYIGTSRRWYRREIRIIRNNKRIRSYRDAQGFRLHDRKLQVKLIDAHIYHYGWVKNPLYMSQKQTNFATLWAGDTPSTLPTVIEPFDYIQEIDELKAFAGTHPAVMQPRITHADWIFKWDKKLNGKNMKWKHKVLHQIEKWTGVRLFEPDIHTNYVLV